MDIFDSNRGVDELEKTLQIQRDWRSFGSPVAVLLPPSHPSKLALLTRFFNTILCNLGQYTSLILLIFFLSACFKLFRALWTPRHACFQQKIFMAADFNPSHLTCLLLGQLPTTSYHTRGLSFYDTTLEVIWLPSEELMISTPHRVSQSVMVTYLVLPHSKP